MTNVEIINFNELNELERSQAIFQKMKYKNSLFNYLCGSEVKMIEFDTLKNEYQYMSVQIEILNQKNQRLCQSQSL